LPLAGINARYNPSTTPGIVIIAQEKSIGLDGKSQNIVFPIMYKFTVRVFETYSFVIISLIYYWYENAEP